MVKITNSGVARPSTATYAESGAPEQSGTVMFS
jgi:hypothetical protein